MFTKVGLLGKSRSLEEEKNDRESIIIKYSTYVWEQDTTKPTENL
jgi:hypothetical protein